VLDALSEPAVRRSWAGAMASPGSAPCEGLQALVNGAGGPPLALGGGGEEEAQLPAGLASSEATLTYRRRVAARKRAWRAPLGPGGWYPSDWQSASWCSWVSMGGGWEQAAFWPSSARSRWGVGLQNDPRDFDAMSEGELEEVMETFLLENPGVDSKAGDWMRKQEKCVQREVLKRGALNTCRNPGASLTSRIREAAEKLGVEILVPPREGWGELGTCERAGGPPLWAIVSESSTAAEILAATDKFLEQNVVDPKSADWLREQVPAIQLAVLKRGSLRTCKNPSAALTKRILEAADRLGIVVPTRPGGQECSPRLAESASSDEILLAMESFLECNPVEMGVADWLRGLAPPIQLHVINRGSLASCWNPSAALASRIREAAKTLGIEVQEPFRVERSAPKVPKKDRGPPGTSVLVPREKTRVIVGRQGGGLSQIRNESGAFIDVKGLESEAPGRWPELRYVHLWGPIEARHSAVDMMVNAMCVDEPPDHQLSIKVVAPMAKADFAMQENPALTSKLLRDYGVVLDTSMQAVDGDNMLVFEASGPQEPLCLGLWDVIKALEGAPAKVVLPCQSPFSREQQEQQALQLHRQQQQPQQQQPQQQAPADPFATLPPQADLQVQPLAASAALPTLGGPPPAGLPPGQPGPPALQPLPALQSVTDPLQNFQRMSAPHMMQSLATSPAAALEVPQASGPPPRGAGQVVSPCFSPHAPRGNAAMMS